MELNMRVRLCCVFVLILALIVGVSSAAEQSPLLATWPTMNQPHIVFLYGGYLWSVPREGGEARQLTTGGHETNPVFSPDGKWIAFTGQYDGNADVFVMPADGGGTKRLPREAYADFDRIYVLPLEGGVPEVLPMWRAESGAYSPDASRFAYVPNL